MNKKWRHVVSTYCSPKALPYCGVLDNLSDEARMRSRCSTESEVFNPLRIRLCLACRNLDHAKCIGPSSISTKCICPSATELNQHEAKSTGPSTTERKGPSTTALPRSTPPQPKDDKNSRDQDRTTSCIKSERCSCMPWQPPWPPRKNGRRSLPSLWLGLGLRRHLPQGREVAWPLREVQLVAHPKLRVHGVWVPTPVVMRVDNHLGQTSKSTHPQICSLYRESGVLQGSPTAG